MRPVRLGGRRGPRFPRGKIHLGFTGTWRWKSVLGGGGSSTESTRSSVEGSARGNEVNVGEAFLTACLQIRSANLRPHHRPPLVLPPRPPRRSTPSPTRITNSYCCIWYSCGFRFFFPPPFQYLTIYQASNVLPPPLSSLDPRHFRL